MSDSVNAARTGGLCFAALLVWAWPVKPLAADVVFLPFLVSGGPDPALVDPDSLPRDLTQAAAFLFQTAKSFPVRTEKRVRRLLKVRGLASHYRADLNPSQSRRVCNALDAEYLMFGHAHFETGRRVRWELRLFGCGSGSVLRRATRTENCNELQPTLVELLREVSTFAGDRPGSRFERPATGSGFVVLLDASGSMLPNLGAIREGLLALLARGGRTLVVYAVRGGNLPERLGPFRDRESAARGLGRLRASGETDLLDMARALGAARSDLTAPDTLLVLTDASFRGNGRSSYEAALRNLTAGGGRLRLFEMPESRLADREATVRLAKSLGLPDASVASGVEARFLESEPETFVGHGGRVFRSRSSVSAAIARNTLPIGLENIGVPGHSERDVARTQAQREGRRIHSFGPLVSGLQAAIESAGEMSPNRQLTGTRVLVKNRSQAFWIRLHNPRDVAALRRLGQKPVYLGLRFSGNRGDVPGMTNHPDFLYIMEQGEVPRLLINEWSHLSRLPARWVRTEDVWFLLCRVIQVRTGDGG